MLSEERKYLVKIQFHNIRRIWIRYPLQKMRKSRLLDVWRNWWSWYLIIRSWKMVQVRWFISNSTISMGSNLDINKEILVENLNFRIHSQAYSQNTFKLTITNAINSKEQHHGCSSHHKQIIMIRNWRLKESKSWDLKR